VRFDGKLSRWNEDRGFGFITPTLGGDDVFVHVSAFPRDGQAPRLHETLSFEVELNKEGKKRATRVRRPGSSRPIASRERSAVRPRQTHSPSGRMAGVALAVVIGALGFSEYSQRASRGSDASWAATPARQADRSSAPAFRCDGRTRCGQMTSCAEARYFLANCPGTKMDGDRDGIPCEQQWCAGAD
jgi:cold shock CspA family protein